MLEAIKNRHSIRFMKKEPINENILMDIIEAGFHAPSGHNNKGWHAFYTTDNSKLTKLSEIHSWAKFVRNSSAVVCVTYDTSEMENFWIEDSAAFMENMLIQATEYGLGSCWIGVRGIEANGISMEEEVRKILNIDPNLKILCLCILGKKAREYNFSKEIDISKRIHKI